MKYALISTLILVLSIMSTDCNKSSTSVVNAPVKCYLTKAVSVHVDSTHTQTDSIWYTYNSGNLLVRSDGGGGWDSLVYTGGKLTSRMSYSAGSSTPSTTYAYTYSGDNLTQIVETDLGSTVHTYTTTITWSGGMVTEIVSTGRPAGQNSDFKNMMWTAGNISSVDFDPIGAGVFIHAVVTYDSKVHNKTVPPTNTGDYFEFFSTNNILLAVTTADAVVGGKTLPAGTKLLDRSLTYTPEGEVAIRTDNFTLQNPGLKITTMTYNCK